MDFNRIMQLFSYVGVILLLLFRSNKYPIKFPRYLLFYLLFILYVFYSAFIQLGREFKVMYLFSNNLIGAFNMMFIIENLVISKKYYNFIIKTSKNILIIAVLVIIFQQVINPRFFVDSSRFMQNFISESEAGNTDRLPSIYSWLNSNSSGFSFIPILILVVEDLDKKKKKVLLWIIMGIIFAFLTKARWVMVNIFLVFFIFFINHKDKFLQFIKYLFILPIIFFISYIVLDIVGINTKGIVEDRILEGDKKSISQKSAGTRLLAFKAFDQLYWSHPFFGVGAIRYGMGGVGKQDYKLRSILKGRSSQIHVGYLSLFYTYGLIGGFLFLSFLYLLLKKLYQNANKTGIWAPFLAFIGFAIANLTLVAFSVFEMGLIIVLVADRYYSQHKNLKTYQNTEYIL